MKSVFHLLVAFFCSALITAAAAQSNGPAQSQSKPPARPVDRTLVDRVSGTGFIQLRAQSFNSLDPKQKELAYWLTQASIAIDPIIYDQLSRFGVRQKRLLEEIVSRPKGIDPGTRKNITDFTKLFWSSRGNHNDMTSQKFLPEFTFEQLQKAAAQTFKNGGFGTAYADLPSLTSADAVAKEVADLRASLFDPNFEPMITAKSPQGGKDILQASSNTYYEGGVTLADIKELKPKYPLNSRLVKQADGKLEEEVYRAGTPDGSIPPGLYAVYLKRANEALANAQKLADPRQAQVIGDLIRYYQTGDPNDWLKFGQDWVGEDSTLDFANGFIEVYRDAAGQKGSSQSFVTVTDKPLTAKMEKLGANAEYFEQHAPWAPQYKKTQFRPPTVKAVETLIETGDFHVNTIGDNLPNENEIREKYGSKNFLFTAASRAFADADSHRTIREFGANPEIVARSIKYGQEAEELHTALHEVIGHGSGKLSDRLKNGSEAELKEYFSTLEEARADLMALWNAFDPKLKELGLISDQDQVAKAMYDSQALVVITQLRRIPHGDTIEEDHQRNRALIANYLIDKGAIRQFDRDGKTYVEVTDYQKMHAGVGELLAELMRIKAEGDYNAIKTLVDKYGVHFDPKLRDQIVVRYKKLDIPTYWAGINPLLTAKLGKSGSVDDVTISYPENAIHQYLQYGSMYDKGLKVRSGE
jgi:dipeptidyl-peptidase III